MKTLKKESNTLIGVFVLGGALIAAFGDMSELWVAISAYTLIVLSVLMGLISFLKSIVEEAYDSAISHKDEMIKEYELRLEREHQHSEQLRDRLEKKYDGGWEQDVDPSDVMTY